LRIYNIFVPPIRCKNIVMFHYTTKTGTKQQCRPWRKRGCSVALHQYKRTFFLFQFYCTFGVIALQYQVMKVTVNQSELLKALKTVSRAVSGQNTLPVLGNILIEAKEGVVSFAATNLEISIKTQVDATIKEEGSITIPAKILTSYVSLLNQAEDVELSMGAGVTLDVKSPSSQTSIKGITADEFPQIADVEAKEKLSIDSPAFRKAVSQVAFSAQENSSRPILSGVYFVAENEELRMVATDSYRLSEKILKVAAVAEKIDCVIPVRAVYEADRLASSEESVVIHIAENQAMFVVGKTHLVTRLINGQFPDYTQIIPKQHVTSAIVDRAACDLAVRRVSIFAKENNQHMKLDFQADGSVRVSTDMTEIGQDESTIPAKIDGKANVIALNADYVVTALNALGGEKEFRIEMQEKMNPAVIKYVGQDDYIHLIMPLKM
jgi:DNA polymerase-3 subunit beta